MRVVVQRVSNASVQIDGKRTAAIGRGLLVFLGIEAEDTLKDVEWLVAKVVKMRIFSDTSGAMNHSLLDIDGCLLVVSQFTLHAATKKGNRPSFIKAAKPDQAIPLYDAFVKKATGFLGKDVATGSFGADMQVDLINDGPVTILVDSKNRE